MDDVEKFLEKDELFAGAKTSADQHAVVCTPAQTLVLDCFGGIARVHQSTVDLLSQRADAGQFRVARCVILADLEWSLMKVLRAVVTANSAEDRSPWEQRLSRPGLHAPRKDGPRQASGRYTSVDAARP